jgi:hypothetical protein
MAAKKEKDLAKKTFNTVAGALFRELGKLFPGDAKLAFLVEELDKFSKTKGDSHVPALKFFKAMSSPSGVHSLITPTEIAPVGELVINKDDRLFTDSNATIPDLDAIDFKGKWATLSMDNKVRVWCYLDRMAGLSAKVATLEALKTEDLVILNKVLSSSEGRAPRDVSQLMQDPAIMELSQKIGERMSAVPLTHPPQ